METEYGVTKNGVNVKRLDTILGEMHAFLSEKWGVNTLRHRESFLNVLLTDIADKIAELWEYGEEVYFSQYPSTAEGVNLDNAAGYGGVVREGAKKSYYSIICTGIDGTELEASTKIASDTNPAVMLTILEPRTITRSSFCKAIVKPAVCSIRDAYTIVLDGAAYTYYSDSVDPVRIISSIAARIPRDDIDCTVDVRGGTLVLEAKNPVSSHSLVLSENLTTETVSSVISFGTDEYGDVYLPDGIITAIVKADPGLKSVVNVGGYIRGNLTESDTELRRAYIDKIYNRSRTMLESIRSAIITNVQGVTSVSVYENDTDVTDAHGRPPHSIEVVAEGGDSVGIAEQILGSKAGGISTYGSVETVIPGEYGEPITVRFNRPIRVYAWIKLTASPRRCETLPPDWADILREKTAEMVGRLTVGDDLVPQEFLSELYRACAGIEYIDVRLAVTDSYGEKPEEYPLRSYCASQREKVYSDAAMTEVALDA